REAQVLEEQPLAVALGNRLRLEHEISEPGSRRDVDLDAVELHAFLLGEQALVRREARLRFRVPCPRAHLHPFELTRERPAPRGLLLLLCSQPRLLLLEPGGVVALVRDAA